jgi:hypothetical protein
VSWDPNYALVECRRCELAMFVRLAELLNNTAPHVCPSCAGSEK